MLSLDIRSIRLFRICLGFILILYAIELVWNQEAFFTDQGVYPRWYLTLSPQRAFLSLSPFFWSGSAWAAQLGLLTLASLGLLLILDRHPRGASVAAFLLLVGILHRAPTIQFGVDVLLRAMTIWSALLPTGAPQGERRVQTPATFGVMAQLALLYGASGFLKSPDVWLWKPDAAYLAMSHVTWATRFGQWLTLFPDLLKLGSQSVFLLERAVPFLLFVPVHTQAVRLMLFVTLVPMHIVFGLTLSLGLFSPCAIAFLTVLIPTAAWDYISAKSTRIGQVFVSSARPISQFKWGPRLAVILLLGVFAAQNIWPLNNPALHYLGLRQRWDLFAPYPSLFGGFFWLRIKHNGIAQTSTLNLDQIASDFSPPKGHSDSIYPSNRWTAALRTLTPNTSKPNFLGARQVAIFYCRKWWEQKGYYPQELELMFTMRFIQPFGLNMREDGHMIMARTNCLNDEVAATEGQD